MGPLLFVLLTFFICDTVDGLPGDDCESVEIRAHSCEEARAWGTGWVPEGYVIIHERCTDQRVASR